MTNLLMALLTNSYRPTTPKIFLLNGFKLSSVTAFLLHLQLMVLIRLLFQQMLLQELAPVFLFLHRIQQTDNECVLFLILQLGLLFHLQR